MAHDAPSGMAHDDPTIQERGLRVATPSIYNDKTLDADTSAGALLGPGQHVGRYRIEKYLAEGGMGVVYKARDPELDRTIALKLVRAGKEGSKDTAGRSRVLREAQALALLSHRNVVGIHDVGRYGDSVFLAMEYADGGGIAAWRAAAERSWRDIVDLYVQVGRGLAAAHEKGLVHRDVKPDNIFLWRDGRVAIGDFGLARGKAEAIADATTLSDSQSVYTPLTRTGAVMGTPPYMAPEQHRGEPADARSDQFSFCVSLWEALYGVRPFAGGTVGELREAITNGVREDPPDASKVPRRVHRVLVRGLSADPEARYPSMRALLADLAPSPMSRGRVLAIGLAAAGVVGLGVGLAIGAGDRTPDACASSDTALVGTWDDGARARARAAYGRVGLPYADASFSRVAEALDDYAGRFTAAHRDACEDTKVRRDYGREVLELRMACLDARRAELAALTGLLADADGDVVRGALEAVWALPAPEACGDVVALRQRLELPADEATRARIAAAQERLAVVRAHLNAGRDDTALSLAQQVVDDTDDLGYRPVEAEARQVLGATLRTHGKLPEADEVLRDAVFRAEAGRADDVAADAWIDLLLVARDRAAWQEVEEHMPRAIAAVERVGSPALLAADLHSALASVYAQQSKWDLARSHYEQARDAAGDALPATRATAIAGLGTVAWRAGDLDDALALVREAHALRERAFGPGHPAVAESLVQLCVIHDARGELDDSLRLYRDALSIYERAYGPEHIRVASAVTAVGGALHQLGRHEEALAVNERALAIRKRVLGDDHPDLGQNYVNMGIALKNLGRLDDALDAYERALGLFLADDEGGFRVAITENNLGELLRKMGRDADALPYYEHSLTTLEALVGADNPILGHPLTGIGEARLAMGDARGALVPLERALALRASDTGSAVDRAQTQFALARALWSAGTRRRALALARDAESAYRSVGEGRAADAVAVAAWLAAR